MGLFGFWVVFHWKLQRRTNFRPWPRRSLRALRWLPSSLPAECHIRHIFNAIYYIRTCIYTCIYTSYDAVKWNDNLWEDCQRLFFCALDEALHLGIRNTLYPTGWSKSHCSKTRHFSHVIHPLTKSLSFSKCLSKPLGFAQENVGRFQVAMHDSMLVQVCQSLWDLASQVGRVVFWLELLRSVEINTLSL